MAWHEAGSSSSSGSIEMISTIKKRPRTKAKPTYDSWGEESDDDLQARFKSRKKRATGSQLAGAPTKPTGNTNGKNKRKRKRQSGASLVDDVKTNGGDVFYTRRDHYNAKRKKGHAGLLLPPEYTEVEFSEDERGDKLQTRPQFGKESGIRPSRAYKDVDMPKSGGVIPAPIAQYLRDYQLDGVMYLHEHFIDQKGCILGDDMGLGKTVQIITFLTVAFGKTGDERDGKRMRKMRNAGSEWYPRVLVVCPGSLIENWKQEFNRWGFWSVMLYHGSARSDVLAAARAGVIEVMITTYETYRNDKDQINEVEWDAVVADECHKIKDAQAKLTVAMGEVNALCRIGLTGTAIQNNYEELWVLLDWANPGDVGTRADWKAMISKPLTIGQSHEATMQELSAARIVAKKLVDNLLPRFFLRRMKSLIADQLPKKTDKVVFCPLTEIQQEAYQNFLASDEVTYVREASDACDCGAKGKDGQPRKRGWCCYKFLPGVMPKKTWQALVFPAIATLQKLSTHLTMLLPPSTESRDKQLASIERLKICLPTQWQQMYKERDSLMTIGNAEFCGKWKILKKLLRFWHENGDKVLIFSHSTRLLRILHHLFSSTSYSVSYLDGSLSYEDRQKEVDTFNSDPSQFVFLISTKAGGVGLNVTAANKVIIFDPHWNPSWDLQAQDRAYRIGQVRDVDVFRLISAGTVEEAIYLRAVYKQQQANIGYNASNERRYFKGVQKDNERKGELFGLKNLFTFHATQIMMRDIVNRTNIAEARAGVSLADFDVDDYTQDADNELLSIKTEPNEDDDDRGASQLAELLTNEDQDAAARKTKRPKSDPIQAVLASAGVEYTHENSEVIGSSTVEAQLSRRAQNAAEGGKFDHLDLTGAYHGELRTSAHLEDVSTAGSEDERRQDPSGSSSKKSRRSLGLGGPMTCRYKPPKDVQMRQFCSMSRHFGFDEVTDFALVVESWTQEQRRQCLQQFYDAREKQMMKDEADKATKAEDDVKEEDAKVSAMMGVDVNRSDNLHVEVKQEAKVEDQHAVLASAQPPTAPVVLSDTESDDEL